MPPTDSKTKIRPQQSCLKCRERKVKCDRAVPCHACIIRGLEGECVYRTTAQDRAHIGQAEIIDRLRREVAQLRAELNQSTREPSRFGAGYGYARASTGYHHSTGYGEGGAGDGAEQVEGNWPASSPSLSATTLTSSATVTSPDSTGSDGGMSAPPVSAAYPASMGPYGTRIAEEVPMMGGDSTVPGGSFMDDGSVSHCHTGTMFAPSTLMHGMPSSTQLPEGVPLLSHHSMHMYRDGSPSYAVNHPNPYMTSQDNHTNWFSHHSSTTGEEDPQLSHHQWKPEVGGNPFPPAPPYASTSYIPPPSSSEPLANPDPSSHLPSYQSASITQGALTNAPRQSAVPHLSENAIPSSWKGERKQELLETLLETIGSCDEDCVAQVIQVVRMSATPEEAVSGICRVLGVAGR